MELIHMRNDPLDYFPATQYRHGLLRRLYIIAALLGILMIVIVMVLTSGCVTASKDIYREMTAPPPTPAPPTPTPTPEPTIAPPPEVVATFGDALHPYQYVDWRRSNVSGYKDLSMHATIYGHKELSQIEWYSVSWGRYITQAARLNEKYLFVYANLYSDVISARTWGIQPHWWVIHNTKTGQMYNTSTDLLPEIRIKDFDETWDLEHKETIQPYGYLRTYNSAGKPTAEPRGYLNPGQSNAWDGYLVYSIPKNDQIEDLVICAPLTDTLNGCWKLQ